MKPTYRFRCPHCGQERNFIPRKLNWSGTKLLCFHCGKKFEATRLNKVKLQQNKLPEIITFTSN